tara:strand:+ start:11899 stop:12339 length:441 start_codon:yes stop_codon:yes gene_type:complete
MAISFKSYEARDKNACLSLFDQNCPDFFAPNEREEYEGFLDTNRSEYLLCTTEGQIVGVFGIFPKRPGECNLNWIMLSPNTQGMGLGTLIMDEALKQAKDINASVIHIATSQVAYKFFEKFGAVIVLETENGWGPDMHKIEMELQL